MDAARPLRDVFADLASDEAARQTYRLDPEGFLGANGHGDLPADLVAEAVVSYADLAPLETAEHLAPVVMAHSAVPLTDAGPPGGADDPDDPTAGSSDPLAGLDLLAMAPAPVDDGDEPAETGGEDAAELDLGRGLDDPFGDSFDDRFGEGDPDLLDHPDLDAEPDGPGGPDSFEGAGGTGDVDHLAGSPSGELAGPDAAEPEAEDFAAHYEADDRGAVLDDVEGPPEEPEEDIADL